MVGSGVARFHQRPGGAGGQGPPPNTGVWFVTPGKAGPRAGLELEYSDMQAGLRDFPAIPGMPKVLASCYYRPRSKASPILADPGAPWQAPRVRVGHLILPAEVPPCPRGTLPG